MKKSLLFLLISNFIWAQWSISNAERSALINLYNSSNGPTWNRTWDLSKDPRTWFGVTVKNGDVVQIALNNNALKGVFPSNLALFTKLQKLDLGNNELNGEVAPSLASLTTLTVLDISNNRLSGDPTSRLSSLSNLEDLSIGGNLFEISDVNATLQNLPKLKSLNISQLQLTEVPAKISSFTKLQQLDLSNNQIVSGFNRLAPLALLQELNLSNNNLTSIPVEVASMQKLIKLNLSHNNISNFNNLGNAQALEQLNLADNKLDQIPSKITTLPNLLNLNLNQNKIQAGFSSLTQLKNLQQLSIDENEIRGGFPSELLNMPKLLMLSLRDNHLAGEIPAKLPPICDLSNNRYNKLAIQRQFMSSSFNYDSFYYSPQRYDSGVDEVLGVLGQPATLFQSLSGPDYTFSWYKNLDENMNIGTENLFFNEVKPEDYGFYTVEAYTYSKIFDKVLQLSLFREPIKLTNKLGVEDPSKFIKIFPNPTTDFINILATNKKVEKVNIYDLSGKQVMSSSATRINVSRLPAGVYMLNIKTDDGIKNFKFIKQ
ncbi:T9SS type A sorting domain-containing protein [Soonwooa sp.]|uniref:T9SS type A sorting domain-containing protein n=1 Tax=Soonwooa sp. TaxID=1938592 RepID=UPI00261C5A25|nr:T9SS type A sorting domain-containing protein [Soonwooa sp.]